MRGGHIGFLHRLAFFSLTLSLPLPTSLTHFPVSPSHPIPLPLWISSSGSLYPSFSLHPFHFSPLSVPLPSSICLCISFPLSSSLYIPSFLSPFCPSPSLSPSFHPLLSLACLSLSSSPVSLCLLPSLSAPIPLSLYISSLFCLSLSLFLYPALPLPSLSLLLLPPFSPCLFLPHSSHPAWCLLLLLPPFFLCLTFPLSLSLSPHPLSLHHLPSFPHPSSFPPSLPFSLLCRPFFLSHIILN